MSGQEKTQLEERVIELFVGQSQSPVELRSFGEQINRFSFAFQEPLSYTVHLVRCTLNRHHQHNTVAGEGEIEKLTESTLARNHRAL